MVHSLLDVHSKRAVKTQTTARGTNLQAASLRPHPRSPLPTETPHARTTLDRCCHRACRLVSVGVRALVWLRRQSKLPEVWRRDVRPAAHLLRRAFTKCDRARALGLPALDGRACRAAYVTEPEDKHKQVAPYCMDRTLVTVDAFVACVQAQACARHPERLRPQRLRWGGAIERVQLQAPRARQLPNQLRGPIPVGDVLPVAQGRAAAHTRRMAVGCDERRARDEVPVGR